MRYLAFDSWTLHFWFGLPYYIFFPFLVLFWKKEREKEKQFIYDLTKNTHTISNIKSQWQNVIKMWKWSMSVCFEKYRVILVAYYIFFERQKKNGFQLSHYSEVSNKKRQIVVQWQWTLSFICFNDKNNNLYTNCTKWLALLNSDSDVGSDKNIPAVPPLAKLTRCICVPCPPRFRACSL